MSVLKKLAILMRSSVREIGESVVDANATRIYEQEILDAKHNVAQARGDLTGVMAKEMQSAREIERLRGEVARYEALALEALTKQQDTLAEEVAGRVAELELELDEQTKAHASYAVQVARLKELIKGAEAKIREHERQIVMAKTTESVYRATRSIADSVDGTGSKLLSAKESLERIRQRHEDLSDRMTAAEQLEREVGSKALEAKLAAAGIGPDADRRASILARIRARAETSVASGGADKPAVSE
ncbi:PspA/IM30 family protein [Uliginosibacterium aquaticum]|uniref:PspA/IM30 family protein n=1 Tax=Uliginosibacterium aquaticum TaxID=2731212 RepID=A0ABX2IRP9_9RHOO|nr:PspA/IM30 family protein [Uliginosibacterium aquaticum]NSL56903.1 PspA/IM30 family protein [Uliginosibacterium aquaticum]